MNTLRDRAIAVFGATGHTGRFVVDELLRRGLVPVAVARDNAKLAVAGYQERGIGCKRASFDDRASVEDALSGVAAVINCAGPFMDTAEPLAAAAIRSGVHYLDVPPNNQVPGPAFDVGGRKAGAARAARAGNHPGLSATVRAPGGH